MCSLPPTLLASLEELSQQTNSISSQRKGLLDTLAFEIRSRLAQKETINITVICTHNSRRSIMGQLWIQAIAIWLNVTNIQVYSGGTTSTQCNSSAITALQQIGFPIITTGEFEGIENGIYESPLSNEVTLSLYSKKFSHENNPKHFIAILVCDSAAEACPYVPGASKRIFISYEDPKRYDGTEQEENEYRTCARRIGIEMIYVLQKCL